LVRLHQTVDKSGAEGKRRRPATAEPRSLSPAPGASSARPSAEASRWRRNIHPPVGKRHARRSAAQRTALSIPPARRTAHVAAYSSNRSITAVDVLSSASSGRHPDSLISSRCSSSISPVICSKCPRTPAAHATLRCVSNFPLALLLMLIIIEQQYLQSHPASPGASSITF